MVSRERRKDLQVLTLLQVETSIRSKISWSQHAYLLRMAIARCRPEPVARWRDHNPANVQKPHEVDKTEDKMATTG